jgi:DNA-binding transcriptional LysR family regulator
VVGRKAEPSAAGRMLYRRGKALLAEAERLEREAQWISEGWEAVLDQFKAFLNPAARFQNTPQ